MRKQEQIKINKSLEKAWCQAILEFNAEHNKVEPVRLRSCKACVIETTHYYFLQSYNTLVAFIDKEQDALIDISRCFCGHSNTRVQHIAKFSSDYSDNGIECQIRLTWR